LIEGAALRLEGKMVIVGTRSIEPYGPRALFRGPATESAIHA
jgi:hypothetical protein